MDISITSTIVIVCNNDLFRIGINYEIWVMCGNNKLPSLFNDFEFFY
jgi:hypothetical protein